MTYHDMFGGGLVQPGVASEKKAVKQKLCMGVCRMNLKSERT